MVCKETGMVMGVYVYIYMYSGSGNSSGSGSDSDSDTHTHLARWYISRCPTVIVTSAAASLARRCSLVS